MTWPTRLSLPEEDVVVVVVCWLRVAPEDPDESLLELTESKPDAPRLALADNEPDPPLLELAEKVPAAPEKPEAPLLELAEKVLVDAVDDFDGRARIVTNPG